MKNLAITLLFSTFSLVVTAQTFDDNFLKNFEKVYQKDPVQFLKNEVGSDFTIIYGDGRLGDKESVLKIYEAFNQVSRTVTELKTRQLGSTGIATGILNHTYTSKKDGSLRDNTNRFTYSFTLQNGKWNLVAVHLTDMPPMPPFDEKTFGEVIQSFKKDIIGYLKSNTAPDYTFTSNGAVVDAKALIKRFETLKVTNWTVSNLKVRQYGTAAFATGTVNHIYTSKVDGSMLNYTDLFSYTFAYKDGKWLCLGGQHSDVPIDIKQEEAAIKKVCIAESQAFSDLDFDAYAAYHVQSADDQLVYNNPNGTYGAKIGWDTISRVVKGWIQAGKKEDVSKVSGDNFTIVIHGDMAFAAYDGRTQKVADGKTTRLRENRTLLYTAGQWKILAVLVYIDYSSGK